MRHRGTVRSALVLVGCLLWVACSAPPRPTEILWDTWGVPHIYAGSETELFRAFGWAQMQSHGDLLLHLIGEARGRAAEYWGEKFLESDRWVRTMGIPGRGVAWYAAQSPGFRKDLDAFAAGMNEFAARHRDVLAPEALPVLPVTAADLLAHTQRMVHFEFITDRGAPERARKLLAHDDGSNAWAIGPSRSASGHAMLLINPHLMWSGGQLFYEAHLVGPGVDFYGATLVGFPVLALGFSDRLGWTHTVNTYDGADTFALRLRDGGYAWDGGVEPFTTREEILAVRGDDGTLRHETLTVRLSRHGPVIAQQGTRAIALRVAGLDHPRMLEEWWRMMRAGSLADFEAALKPLDIPMFNVLYADREGNIFYLYNGLVPRRARGDYAYWEKGPAPGDDPSLLWDAMLPYDALPRILNPPQGWLQNANDPPWYTTFPPALDPAKFPSYLAPHFMHFRAQESASLLQADPAITFDELVAYKHSTRMLLADRLLDDLLAASAKTTDPDVREAAGVLAAWDRRADAGSRGAVLFLTWADEIGFGHLFDDGLSGYDDRLATIFATPWDESAPFTTPDGLRDPAAAAAALGWAARKVRARHGALDVPYGDVFRLRMGDRDLPANGAPGDPGGVFRTAYFAPDDDGRMKAIGGDTFYAAVEFGRPTHASVLLSYGNSTQPGSPHHGDQLDLFARQQMRPAWRTREEIETHLEERSRLTAP